MTQERKILWHPSDDFIDHSNLKKYERWLRKTNGLQFDDYQGLWQWSVNNRTDFWSGLWQYFEVIAHSDFSSVWSGPGMPGTRWFEGSTLNYAEHIFRNKSNERPAIIFRSEDGQPIEYTWDELETQVAGVRNYLVKQGISRGDTVAAYLPNTPEAIIAFLATNSLGAIWSCCSPDFGSSTVIDRFTQIEPKLLFAMDGYPYGGKFHDRSAEVRQIVDQIGSPKVVLVPYSSEGSETPPFDADISWQQCIAADAAPLSFEPVPFDHPIWVLYSSGTTGRPKAITHSHGGVLLEHLKYMHFHNDVKPGENFFWFTTTGWMMWNFLQASLLAGATLVLYDGSPGHPNLHALWAFAEELPIHHFGTSAPFLTACMHKGLKPGEKYDLTGLRSIGSTGAPLPAEAFDWVYRDVSEEVWLCSMSGGTDVCTAFVGGIPYEPVRRGTIQGRALGCDLQAMDESGKPVLNSLGEMVISTPMPSMPVFFWNDKSGERYRSSYFEKFPGRWCHGDWIKLHDDGSLIIQGRSDATLNRKGIRIGTAEIYTVVDSFNEIEDSLILNLEKDGGGDIMPLFVVLREGPLNRDLQNRLKEALRTRCSPRHIPDKIISVPHVPYTLSGKKMEVPIKKILMGMDGSKSLNPDATRNPEAVRYFMDYADEFRKRYM